MTKSVCKTKLGQNEWQTAIEVTRFHTYWGITEQKGKKRKKTWVYVYRKKIKIYNKGRKNEKKSHYYIFCIHYQEVLDFMQIILNYFIEILEKYLKAGRVFFFISHLNKYKIEIGFQSLL